MSKPKPLMVQVAERSRMRGTGRQVLFGFAYYGNPDGTSITASPREVAKKAGVSLATLERYRPQLLELGELVIVTRDRHGEHAEYAIELPGQNRHLADSESEQNPQQGPQVGDSGDNARERDRNPGNPGEDGKPSSRRLGQQEESRPDIDRLCVLLATLIAENGRPEHLIAWPSDGWRRAARLLLDQEGRDAAEVERLVRWCQANDFWRSNVLSMPKFRKQYDTLRLQAARGRSLAAVQVGNGRMSKADRVDADVRDLLAEARGGRL